MPLLKVENLAVSLGERPILTQINFTLEPGEIVGVIGPNGSGKTTLLNALSGFVPTRGRVQLAGRDLLALPSHRRARIGLTRGFQHAGVFREMTVRENLIFTLEQTENWPWWWQFRRARRVAADAQIDVTLGELDLLPHKNALASALSGGQLRLLELARLTLSRGRLFLIDEPTAGVAPALRGVLGKALRQLVQKQGATVLLVEHDLKFLFELVDRVIVLVDGQKYLEGPPAAVRADPRLQEIYFGK